MLNYIFKVCYKGNVGDIILYNMDNTITVQDFVNSRIPKETVYTVEYNKEPLVTILDFHKIR